MIEHRELFRHGYRSGIHSTLATKVLQFLRDNPQGYVLTVAGTPYEEDALWYYIKALTPLGVPLHVADNPLILMESNDSGEFVRTAGASVHPSEIENLAGAGSLLMIVHDASNLHPDDLSHALLLAEEADSRVIVASMPVEGPGLRYFRELEESGAYEVTVMSGPDSAYPREPVAVDPLPVEPEPEPDPTPAPDEEPTDVDEPGA